MWVRFPPRAHRKPPHILGNEKVLAYLIGVGIGDGNLSLLNGRTVRLRVSCDTKYPQIIRTIIYAIKIILPENKINIVKNKGNCVDIVSFSNLWEQWLGWRADGGSKMHQCVSIPKWIKENGEYKRACLRGLIETDGSIYLDRGYRMVNFTSFIFELASDVLWLLTSLGYKAHMYKLRDRKNYKYIIRISKNVDQFIKEIGIKKS